MINIKSSDIEYRLFEEVDPGDFIFLLNKKIIRRHLIEHETFTNDSVREWMGSKMLVDSSLGCRVRAVFVEQRLVGWCGIQKEDDGYEIAIVIDDRIWGIGKEIFKDNIVWARNLGHTEIYIHFLNTRPEYMFLKKLSKRVDVIDMLGQQFTRYLLELNSIDRLFKVKNK